MIEDIKDYLWIIATLLGTYKIIHDIRKDSKKKRPNRKKGRKK